jgi:hypothetical protein
VIRVEQNQSDQTEFVINMSKKLKVAFSNNYADSNPDKNEEHYLVSKKSHDRQRTKWNYKEQKRDIEEDRSFKLDKIYTGKIRLVKIGCYQKVVVAILPDLFGENCHFGISKETIFDALNDGLLCKDGSFYGPFKFFIGSGNRTVSIITAH